jgi:hypothetical protein
MINLTSYSLFFLGNFLTIIFIPDSLVQSFLGCFSIFSLIIGPANFILFSRFLEKKFFFLKIILLINLMQFLYIDNFTILIFVYTINIFFSDFLSSQLKFSKLNFIYKLIFFLISFLLILDFASINQILELRIILSSILLIFVLISKLKHIKLDVKYPVTYQLLTNINYYLPLYLTTLVLEMFKLKLVYVTFQIGFGLILKSYDLRIRKIIDENIFNFYNKFLYLIILLLPLIFFNFNIESIIYFVYYSSVLIFIYVKKKLL